MTGGLAAIVAALGGDLWDGGRRASVPAPGHSARDRSVSLWIAGDRLLIHAFSDADWRRVRDDLVRRGLVGENGRLPDVASAVSRPVKTRAVRIDVARRIWSELAPIEAGSPAARHLRRRAVAIDPRGLVALRFGQVPLRAYEHDGPTRSALAAAVGDPARPTALEITYLDAGGRRARDLRLSRKIIGVLEAGAVELATAAPEMLVGEGVFTVLSAMARFGYPGHALLSAHRLRLWSPPAEVRHVLIAADPGRVGEDAAGRLAWRLEDIGVRASIALPTGGVEDWNALAVLEGEGREAEGGELDGDRPRSTRGKP